MLSHFDQIVGYYCKTFTVFVACVPGETCVTQEYLQNRSHIVQGLHLTIGGHFKAVVCLLY